MSNYLNTVHEVTKLFASAAPPKEVLRAILETTTTMADATHSALLVQPSLMSAVTGKPNAPAEVPLSHRASLVSRGTLADGIRDWEGAEEPTSLGNILVVPMNTGGIAIVDAIPGFQDSADNLLTLQILADLASSALQTARNIADAESRTHTLEDTRRRLREQNSLLRELTVIDELTGLYNRRFFDRRLSYEIDRFHRNRTPLSLVLFDVDHFKKVNDNHGHATGDEILKHLSNLANESVRKSDILARYGGEEFAILMPESDSTAAAAGADRVRASIADNPMVIDGVSIEITISAGVSTVTGDWEGDSERLIRSADEALYRAKANGRNCIITSTQHQGS